MAMISKMMSGLKVILFVGGAAAMQACFFGGGHPYYARPAPYAYGPAPVYAEPPVYAYAPPARAGDYDGRHVWRDRDWWVRNDRPWVTDHHPEWVGHDRDRDHDHDRH